MPTKSKSSIATDLLPNPHPGEILLEEFLKPMGISQYRLAKEIGVPAQRIGEIVAGKRAITADTVVCLQDVNDPLSLTKQREVRMTLRAVTEAK